jgi:hypothetical protein
MALDPVQEEAGSRPFGRDLHVKAVFACHADKKEVCSAAGSALLLA